MYGPYPVRGVYTQALDGGGEVCLAVWNESETLAEVRLRVDAGLDESVSIPAPPSPDHLAVCRRGYGLAPEGLVF